MWELHVLDGLADGLRAIELGLDLIDDLRGVAEPPALRVLPGLPPTRKPLAAWLACSTRSPGYRIRSAAHGLTRQAEVAGETVRVATGVVKTLPSPAPPSSLNVAVGPTRRLGMHQLDLDDLHLVRKQHGATVNDVVLAVVTGGLRSWMTATEVCPTSRCACYSRSASHRLG